MRILRIIGISLLALGGLAGVVLLLLPFGILHRDGLFLGQPERSLWLLFILGLTFGGIFSALGMKNRRRWQSAKVGGSALLVLGFVCALAIFLIEARMPDGTRTGTLWWLFVICSLLGGIAVYAADWAERRAEKVRAEEAQREAEDRARAEERKSNPAIVLLKVRR